MYQQLSFLKELGRPMLSYVPLHLMFTMRLNVVMFALLASLLIVFFLTVEQEYGQAVFILSISQLF